MEFLTAERYDFALAALLPGFLIFFIFLSFKKAPLPKVSSLFIASVIISFVYKLVLEFFLSFSFNFAVASEVARLVNLVLIPIGLGVLWATSFDSLREKLSKVGFHTRHPIPNAWDQAFANREGCWIIVHLNSGVKIRGSFIGQSLASSTNDERGIYLEHTYMYNVETEEWEEPKRKSSVLVTPSSIEHIEFIEAGEEYD